MIPARALPMRMTVIHPAQSTDGYGDAVLDYGTGATVVENVPAYVWLSLVDSSEDTRARDTSVGSWTLLTNYVELAASDRILYDGISFEVVGPAATLVRLDGTFHHVEARLRSVEG